MLIVLRRYELNTLLRRRDDVDFADLTKARVLENSVRFSENELSSALNSALSADTLLYLDLRLLPDSIHGGPVGLPPLELPEREQFVYHDPPRAKALKTYRLDYLLSREGREVEPPRRETVDGRQTLIVPAPPIETIASSLECEADELRAAVKLIAAPANGSLSWLRIRVFNDPLRSGRPLGHFLDWAEPQAQFDI